MGTTSNPTYIKGTLKVDGLTVPKQNFEVGNATADNIVVSNNLSVLGAINGNIINTVLAVDLTEDDVTLTAAEQARSIFNVKGHATNVLYLNMPDGREITISANTANALITNTADGTPVTVAATKTAKFYTLGDEVIRITADA